MQQPPYTRSGSDKFSIPKTAAPLSKSNVPDVGKIIRFSSARSSSIKAVSETPVKLDLDVLGCRSNRHSWLLAK
ncbi:MAG: hypothetical protein NTV34_10515 [Proteobacteria bacterium]|nr:hypothetical protein [Pseudomonadota bacterium]